MFNLNWRQRGFFFLWILIIIVIVVADEFFSLIQAMEMDNMKEKYSSKYDNFDVDQLLNQERLLNHYIKCLEDKGPCTPDGKMLKEILPDAVSSDCSKCTEKQKQGSDKINHYLIIHRPDDWTRLEKIYDPEGTYRKNYLADVDSLKIMESTLKEISK